MRPARPFRILKLSPCAPLGRALGIKIGARLFERAQRKIDHHGRAGILFDDAADRHAAPASAGEAIAHMIREVHCAIPGSVMMPCCQSATAPAAKASVPMTTARAM